MDAWLSAGRAIEDAGGWAAFFSLIVLIGLGLWRGWWVPGFWYRELLEEVKGLRKTVVTMTAELARERRRRRTDA